MTLRYFTCLLLGSLLLAAANGCCCVDSCCNPSVCDFGGAGCNATCGASCGSQIDGGYLPNGRGNCGGGGCGGGSCSGGSAGGCAGWNTPQFFVDEYGQPCMGPLFGVVNAVRNAYMGASCGCGGVYVDEWISDPPLCRDPCGDGCMCSCDSGSTCGACDSCGPAIDGGGYEEGGAYDDYGYEGTSDFIEPSAPAPSGGCNCASRSQSQNQKYASRSYEWGTNHPSPCRDGSCQTARKSPPARRPAPTTANRSRPRPTMAKPPEPSTRRVRYESDEDDRESSEDDKPRRTNPKSWVRQAGWFH